MIQPIILLHRYLGIAVGGLMVMWCLSGMVMMYVGYPVLEEPARLQALTPIDWNGCCKVSPAALDDAARISDAQVEMLSGRPVLAVRSDGRERLVDLRTGVAVPRISPEQAASVARGFAKADSWAACA